MCPSSAPVHMRSTLSIFNLIFVSKKVLLWLHVLVLLVIAHLPYDAAVLQAIGNVFKLMIRYKIITFQGF